MMSPRQFRRGPSMGHCAAALAVVISGGLAACAVDTAPSTFSTGYGGASSGGAGGGSPQPMLVVVDSNRTLNAPPGQGVGVFVQYQSGGTWQVSWTCDTSLTNLPCGFQVDISVTTGSIGSTQGPSAPELTQVSPQEIDVATTTTTGTDGVSFVTSAGATITVDAAMNGTPSGSYFFFVQDDQVNGGYKGTLTDPLMLVPLSP